MSMQQYGGGVIWAGREGIHFFDGIQTENLTAGQAGRLLEEHDPDVRSERLPDVVDGEPRPLLPVHREHLPDRRGREGHDVSTPTRYTVVINMVSRAITLLTNVNLRGAVTLPASAGRNSWYLVNGRVAGT
jgi:hypothetical protein